ncbi:putative uncharacterized protein DDB_G0274535 [Procambarus clarkii]|uniref:putative uncharacterized protein DDB_G0274535 n=1 Tax=Procambarus clarkii TaxID=6728 RepID=UPI003744A873
MSGRQLDVITVTSVSFRVDIRASSVRLTGPDPTTSPPQASIIPALKREVRTEQYSRWDCTNGHNADPVNIILISVTIYHNLDLPHHFLRQLTQGLSDAGVYNTEARRATRLLEEARLMTDSSNGINSSSNDSNSSSSNGINSSSNDSNSSSSNGINSNGINSSSTGINSSSNDSNSSSSNGFQMTWNAKSEEVTREFQEYFESSTSEQTND